MATKKTRPKHSAFEGPAIGSVVNVPKGMKMVVDKNGLSKLVKAGKKSGSKKK